MAPSHAALPHVCLSCRRLLAAAGRPRHASIRYLTTESIAPESPLQSLPPKLANVDLSTISNPRTERQLARSRVYPIGSRRRRAALQSSRNIPFEQLPYQCFQEARKVLQEDRAEKLADIAKERERIREVEAEQVSGQQEEWRRQNRLRSMRRYLEYTKIQADINDPLVKKRFEDGQGDMTRSIYRHLAECKWKAQGGKYMINEQRIRQMHIVPDILPSLELTADISLSMRGTKPASSNMVIPRISRAVGGGRVPVQPGEFVASAVAEHPPRIEVQVFDKGPRMVTVAVVDPDVPNTETDNFDHRCHFLAINIPIAPDMTTVRVDTLASNQVILPWLPPYAQKGSPYHRLAVLVFEQPKHVEGAESKTRRFTPTTKTAVDKVSETSSDAVEEASVPETIAGNKATEPPNPSLATVTSTSTSTPHGARRVHNTLTLPCDRSAGYIAMPSATKKVTAHGGRKDFVMRAFADRYELKPIGATLFRVQWDEWMDGVMRRLGVEGAGEELRRKKPESLPYKKKDGRRFRGAGGSGLGRN